MTQTLTEARSLGQEDGPPDVGPQAANPTQSTSAALPPTTNANPTKRKSADSSPEDTAPRKKIAGSTILQSAKSFIIMGVFRQTQKDATANATLSTQMPAQQDM